MAEEMLPLTKYLSYEKSWKPAISSTRQLCLCRELDRQSRCRDDTTKVLEQYPIDAIINIGLAGSLTTHLEFGDVVVVKHTIEHDGLMRVTMKHRSDSIHSLISSRSNTQNSSQVSSSRAINSSLHEVPWDIPGKRWATRRYGVSRSRQSRTPLPETTYLSRSSQTMPGRIRRRKLLSQPARRRTCRTTSPYPRFYSQSELM